MTTEKNKNANTATENTAAQFPRAIKSYVLRQGRMSAAQTRYLNEMMPKIGVPITDAPLDLIAIFGRNAPCVLEIGFGMGDTSAEIAKAHPTKNYLCIEVHAPAVGNLCKRICEEGISNIRIIQFDAVFVLEKMITENSLAGINIFFPDPWHKKRHQKRRLIQAPFVNLLAKRLETGGFIHFASDWQDYAEQALSVFSAETLLQNTAEKCAENANTRLNERPLTRFENRGLRLGHEVWDILLVKK